MCMGIIFEDRDPTRIRHIPDPSKFRASRIWPVTGLTQRLIRPWHFSVSGLGSRSGPGRSGLGPGHCTSLLDIVWKSEWLSHLNANGKLQWSSQWWWWGHRCSYFMWHMVFPHRFRCVYVCAIGLIEYFHRKRTLRINSTGATATTTT